MFQSPSYRGGSTPNIWDRRYTPGASSFQSPSYRGGSTPLAVVARLFVWICVSIPFLSGREHSLNPQFIRAEKIILFQSPSYRGGSTPMPSSRFCVTGRSGFNPLLIGAGALPTESRPDYCALPHRFNPLLIGAGALPYSAEILGSLIGVAFQSPSYRGGSTPG